MNNLCLLEKINEIDFNENTIPKNSDVIAFDYHTHKILSTHHIPHTIIDDYVSEKDREEFFHSASSFWNWYENFHDKNFFFHDINLLSIIDRNELHEFLMILIPKIKIIKHILDKNTYSKIYVSCEISKLIKSFSNYETIIFEKNKSGPSLTYDKITLSYGKIPSSIMPKIERKKFMKLKKIYENTISSIFKLNQKLPDQKKIILIEFNPEVYESLLYEISRNGIQPVLLNFRRPSTWSLNSINILRKTNSLVILPKDILGKKKLSEIKNQTEIIFKKIKTSFEDNHNISSKLFVYEKIKFNHIMIELFLRILKERLEEYITQILISEELNKMNNILCGITLNLSGEMEKTFSQKIKTFQILLLQHAFSNYTPSISHLDALDDFHLIKNKIIVWGEEVKKYIIENRAVHEDKIIVSGSPKYDSFVATKKNNENKKTVLVTPRPIIHHVEGLRIELYEKYEKTIDKLLELTKIDNIEVIFKLHPQQIEHNEIIKQYIKNKNPNIKILQYRSIRDLLTQCDLHVNIAPDNFDASSVILEAMILERPTLNIQLQSTKIEFEFMKHGAVKTINFESDIREQVKQLLNKETSYELIKNSQKYLKQYISNHGNASTTLVNIIKNSS